MVASVPFQSVFAALSDEPVEEPASTVAAEPLDLSADADIKLEDDAIEFELPEDVALPEDIEVPADTELSLDDFELPEMDEVAPPVVEEEAALATESDEEDDEFDFLSGTDECATKLDLARAYIDMGDQEGARDILNEVIEEGNDQQKQEAQSMMEHLAD